MAITVELSRVECKFVSLIIAHWFLVNIGWFAKETKHSTLLICRDGQYRIPNPKNFNPTYYFIPNNL